MPWLVVIVLAYFLFAIVSLVDRYLLIGPLNAKIYTFYVGVLGILALLLIPLVGFSIPGREKVLFCLLAGVVYIFALFAFLFGLERFEASIIVPAVGGFLPIFTFVLVYFFSGGKEILNLREFLAFILLIFGSMIICWKGFLKISFAGLGISLVTALFSAFSLILAKYVYLMLPFWTGFIWIRVGAFLTVLFFIFIKEVRKEVFIKRPNLNRKTGILFFFAQVIGGGAFILQNWAIALAGLVYLSVINALQGIQYVFLFVLTILFLKEGREKKDIFQKIIAILFIGAGLVILTL